MVGWLLLYVLELIGVIVRGLWVINIRSYKIYGLYELWFIGFI